jgi:hypothetical protein
LSFALGGITTIVKLHMQPPDLHCLADLDVDVGQIPGDLVERPQHGGVAQLHLLRGRPSGQAQQQRRSAGKPNHPFRPTPKRISAADR